MRQMGGCSDHPSPLRIKHCVKNYLLGRDIELVGTKYNTHTQENDISISESFFSNSQGAQPSDISDSLNEELCMSAMMFCSLDLSDSMPDQELPEETEIFFEEEMEKEGLQYLGGYIVHKFPQYGLLGSETEGGSDNWIKTISRHEWKLKEPSRVFFRQLREMEAYFKCYHGEKSLQVGKNAVKTLTNEIAKYVKLPLEVITFFVKCRIFFRMRILNRGIKSSRQIVRKMKKLTN